MYLSLFFYHNCGFSIFHFAKGWLPLVTKLELELDSEEQVHKRITGQALAKLAEYQDDFACLV